MTSQERRPPSPSEARAADARLTEFDWASTALGPVEDWPRSLLALARMIVTSRQPKFIYWGPQLRVICNDATRPILGAKHPSCLGLPVATVFAEAWTLIGPQLEAVMTRGEAFVQQNIKVPIYREGELRDAWWNYSYSPVYDDDGAIAGVFCVATETTAEVEARQRVEQIAGELRRAHQRSDLARRRLDGIIHSAPVFITLLRTPEHVFELANPAYMQMIGEDREVLGKPVREALPELEGQGFFERLDRVYATGIPFEGKEVPVRLSRSRGMPLEEAFVTFTYDRFYDADGRVDGIAVFGFDVTEMVLARRKLEVLAEEQRVARDQAEELQRRADAASVAKDEFLAMLGHELRNPLAPIITVLDLLKLRSDGALDREHQILERQVAHLVRLVDDLLDVSKITRGKIALKYEWVEISDVVARAVEVASVLIDKHQHQLSVDVPTGLRLRGDAIRLTQVVSNLLTNAARYTHRGGTIQVVAFGEDTDVVLEVRDNGRGIPPPVMPRLFDRFFQGKRSADRTEGGLGLGLALVKTLVGLHGGTVSAYSAGIGKGSTFTIHLPLPRRGRTSAAVDDTSAAPRPRDSHARIMVVDDNEDAASLLAELLRAANYEVEVAHDPLGALSLAERFEPQLAILDIGLPMMNGYELAQKLRERLGETCRLVALTGYGHDHELERSAEAGFSAHLIKPVDVDRLLTCVADGAEPREPLVPS